MLKSITIRRCLCMAGVLLLCLACAEAVMAQVPAPASNTTTISRPLYFEIMLTVVMCGVALFAVCRNSNRN